MIDLKPVVEELVVLEKPVRAVKEDSEMSLTQGKAGKLLTRIGFSRNLLSIASR